MLLGVVVLDFVLLETNRNSKKREEGDKVE